MVGILMVPVYVRYMGVEAYGLVGFFALLQAWFQLLDAGLSPTMMRQTARYLGGGTDALSLRCLVRAMEGFFISVGLIGCLSMIFGSNFIASQWLKVQNLSHAEVREAVVLMAVIVTLRWVSELYRGAITGFERLVWLNTFGVIITTARFILVVIVLKWVGSRPVYFFAYQLAIGVVELAILATQTYRFLPRVPVGKKIPWEWGPLKDNLKFSLTIAFTGSVWVIVTQTDKLVLSKLLPLTEYAYFTLAVLAASGVMIVFGPVSSALLPRMARLSAEGAESALMDLYRNATQIVGVVAVPVAMMLAFFPEQVLWAWTGNMEIAHLAAPILRLYAIGNGFMVLAAFPYFLQFAKGDMKLHLIGNGLFILVLLPGLIWATRLRGANGAGWVWVSSNMILFLLWIPVVHRRFLVDLHLKWLMRDVLQVVISGFAGALVIRWWFRWPMGRLHTTILLICGGLCVLVAAITGSSWFRFAIQRRWNRSSVSKESID